MENKKVPGKYSNPIKNFLDYRKDPLGYFQKQTDQFGDFSYINMMGKNVYLVSNPEAVDYILQKNSNNFLKGRTTQKLKKVIGNGLITSEGQSWKKNNSLIRKSFTLKTINSLAPLFRTYSMDLCSHLNDKKEIDILSEMNTLSLKIIFRSLFNQDIEGDLTQFIHNVHYIMDHILYLTRSILPIPSFIPTVRSIKFNQALEQIDLLIEKVINKRKEDINKGIIYNDILSLLLNRETQGEISQQQIHDEIITLLMAGHETITNTLTFSFILLCQNTKYFEELNTFANEVFKENKINTQLLESNNIAKQVINESMRLYPPVWVFMRENIEKDNILKYEIPKKSMLILAPYYTHRSEKYWQNSLEFRPERFEVSNINANIEGVKFFPFGHGPRICLGNNLAYLEAQIILLSLIQHFQFELEKPEKQRLSPGITIRAINNLNFKITKR